MSTVEFAYNEDVLATFDGEIVEVFCTEFGGGNTASPYATSRRILPKLLSVRVCNPDKKGHRNVEFWGPNLGLYMFNNLDEAAISRIQPLLAALKAAGVKFDSPP